MLEERGGGQKKHKKVALKRGVYKTSRKSIRITGKEPHPGGGTNFIHSTLMWEFEERGEGEGKEPRTS